MKTEEWIEICKEMAPHLRALELIAKNNNLDILCVGMGTKTYAQATWIEDDTGTHFRCNIVSARSFEAGISNVKADISEKFLLLIEKPLEPGSRQGQKNNISHPYYRGESGGMSR